MKIIKLKEGNIVQQCKYDIITNKVLNDVGCTDKGKNLLCHKIKVFVKNRF